MGLGLEGDGEGLRECWEGIKVVVGMGAGEGRKLIFDL